MKINRILLASIITLVFNAVLVKLPFMTPEKMMDGFAFAVYFLCMNEILKYYEK